MHAVETIGDVAFELADRAMLGVCVDNALKEAWKRPTKLHRFGGSQADGLLIETGVAVVNDGVGAARVLRDDAGGGDAKSRLLADGLIGEDHPLASLAHDRHLIVEEVGVLKGRFVGAALHSGVTLGGGPVRCVELAGHALMLHVAKDATGGVWDVYDVIREVGRGSETAYSVDPAMSPEESSSFGDIRT
jgi:hypothetical protein